MLLKVVVKTVWKKKIVIKVENIRAGISKSNTNSVNIVKMVAKTVDGGKW